MLQKQLDSLSDWGSKWGMRYGIAKCGVMLVRDSSSSSSESKADEDDTRRMSLFLQGELLPVVESYKYLGVTITNTLDWSEEVKRRKKAMESAIGILSPLISCFRLSVNARLAVAKAKVMPCALWGCEVWAENETKMKKIQGSWNELVIKCLGVPPSRVCAAVARFEAGVKDIFEMARRRQARAILKWLHDPRFEGTWIREVLTHRKIESRKLTWCMKLFRWFRVYIGTDLDRDDQSFVGVLS